MDVLGIREEFPGLSRSSDVAWSNLGYQANDTEMMRLSVSATVSVSSVAVTVMAPGTANSTIEVAIPILRESYLIPLDDPENPAELRPAEIAAALQFHGVEPELGETVVTPHMECNGLYRSADTK